MIVEMMVQQVIKSLKINSVDDALAVARKYGVEAVAVPPGELEAALLDLAREAMRPGMTAIRAEFAGEQGKLAAFLVLPSQITDVK